MMRSGGCPSDGKKTPVSSLRTIWANLSTVPIRRLGLRRYTSSSMVATGNSEPPKTHAGFVHSTVYLGAGRAASHLRLCSLQAGHRASCLAFSASSAWLRASLIVFGVAPLPTHKPIENGTLPRLVVPD